eukprot:TRINITY_DN1831_c0_g1_i1.p1 TRINITY_DN1831_c0_g1~~TRINITY_DN1831_c0_g1_i1.p1  ORF type:complete len:136 (-),score=24.98 TRINITY_DN1831_c0_g1_i1:27-413(-)
MWFLVHALLVVEVVFGLLLVLPLPLAVRNLLVSGVNRAYKQKFIQSALIILVLLLAAALFFAWNATNRIQLQKVQEGANHHRHLELNARLFREQRNMYLSGFSLYLLVLLTGVGRLIRENYLSARKAD